MMLAPSRCAFPVPCPYAMKMQNVDNTAMPRKLQKWQINDFAADLLQTQRYYTEIFTVINIYVKRKDFIVYFFVSIK